jgi:hypothetical protein
LRVEKLRKTKKDSLKDICDVSDCNLESKRAVSMKKVKDSLPKLKFDKTVKKVHLCKDHYKQFKKATKSDRKLERLTWD